MFCPSCGSEYRDGYTDCVDCGVSLVQELPSGRNGPSAPAFPRMPRGTKKPFVLSLLGVCLLLAGGSAILGTIVAVARNVGPESSSVIKPWTEIVADGLVGLAAFAVSIVILRGKTWGRSALITYILFAVVADGWLKGALIAWLIAVAAPLAVLLCYLYLWPSVVDYYEWLRETRSCADEPPTQVTAPDS